MVGSEISPGQPSTKPDGTVVSTLWGELAWQLGGAEAYETLAQADRTGTNPGRALRTLLARYAPALILVDEWVAYARGLYRRDDLVGGSFDTQFTFAQELTAAVLYTRVFLIPLQLHFYPFLYKASSIGTSSMAP